MPTLTERIDFSPRYYDARGEHLDRKFSDGFRPEYIGIAFGACLFGATVEALAEKFEVTLDTFNRWMFKYPDLKRAVDYGREHVDYQVAEALVQRALGFHYDAVKLFKHEHEDGTVEIIEKVVQEYVPPDVQAQKFHLTNRRPDKWSNRDSHELSGPGGKPIQLEDTTAREILERRLAGLLDRAQPAGTPRALSGPDG